MSDVTPKLRKRVCLKSTRVFEQLSLTGDPLSILEYIAGFKGTGTLHIHFSQGSSNAADWDTRHVHLDPPITP